MRFKNIIEQYKKGDTDIFTKLIEPHKKKGYTIYVFSGGTKIFNSFLNNYLNDYQKYFPPDEISSIFISGFSEALASIKRYENNAAVIEYFKETIRRTFLKTYNLNSNRGTVPITEGGVKEDIPFRDIVDIEKYLEKSNKSPPVNTDIFSKLLEENSTEIKLSERQKKVFSFYQLGWKPSLIATEVYPDLSNKKGLKKVNRVRGEIRRKLVKLAKKYGLDTTSYFVKKSKSQKDFSIPEYQRDIKLLNKLLEKVEYKIKEMTNIKKQIEFYRDQKKELTKFINHAKHEMKYIYNNYYLKYDKNIFKKANKYYDKTQKTGG